ncbi:uncharacterized protein LOC113040727 [Carassius auratus]|uniref:Uncharacterized protein LOC113040727 n=1 Tax=Carassius auratus TaxID=7957 RepID=A0A6P6J3U9_CARAU|nr:uncharacterized protein LOC113040727 [Carassius auratus]
MTLLQTTTLSDSLFKLQSCWKKMIKENTLVLFCLCSFHLVGVFADTDTVKSVKEGDSVTLQINVTEIQTDDEIEWKFGTNRSRIAEINGKTSKIFDGPDGRFRDRLKLDHQTGSLIITNTRTTDSGLYEMTISRSSSEDTHRFNVTVYGYARETKCGQYDEHRGLDRRQRPNFIPAQDIHRRLQRPLDHSCYNTSSFNNSSFTSSFSSSFRFSSLSVSADLCCCWISVDSCCCRDHLDLQETKKN